MIFRYKVKKRLFFMFINYCEHQHGGIALLMPGKGYT